MDASVLLIGAGKMAGLLDEPGGEPRSHAEGIAAVDGIELIADVDPNPEKRERFAKTHRVSSFETIDQGLALSPDVVVICSPDATHASYLAEVATAGYSPSLVIVEKPCCTSDSELATLREAVFEFPVVVNHTRQFVAQMQGLARLLHSRPFGAFVHARFVYYGGWLVNGVHAVDLFPLPDRSGTRRRRDQRMV